MERLAFDFGFFFTVFFAYIAVLYKFFADLRQIVFCNRNGKRRCDAFEMLGFVFGFFNQRSQRFKGAL